jgi:hypothetical protein
VPRGLASPDRLKRKTPKVAYAGKKKNLVWARGRFEQFAYLSDGKQTDRDHAHRSTKPVGFFW